MMFYSQQYLVTSSRSRTRGTLLWMAPELFAIDENKDVSPSKESDMWAYGMVIYVCDLWLFASINLVDYNHNRNSSPERDLSSI